MLYTRVVLFVFFCVAESQKTCTDMSFSNLVQKYNLAGSEFHAFPNTTLLVCAKQCKLRRRCVSFNFDLRSGYCVLNEGSATKFSLNFTGSLNDVYSEADVWPEVLAGACASHTCPENSLCMFNETGLYDCVVEACVDPPAVTNAQPSRRFIRVGDAVPYECEVPFIPSGETICLPNNTWNGEFKCLRLRSCLELKACNSSYGDGEYWIYVKRGTFSLLKVYCHDMENNPTSYLTLNGNTYSDTLNASSIEKCEGIWPHRYCGKTIFHKVMLNPWKIMIRPDYTFATTNCLFSPLGWAGGCSLCSDSPVHGSFRIDTSGTGVKVAEKISWISNTGQMDVTWNRTGDGTIVTGECQSKCGYCKPAGANVGNHSVPLVLDLNYKLDFSQATFPQCAGSSP